MAEIQVALVLLMGCLVRAQDAGTSPDGTTVTENTINVLDVNCENNIIFPGIDYFLKKGDPSDSIPVLCGDSFYAKIDFNEIEDISYPLQIHGWVGEMKCQITVDQSYLKQHNGYITDLLNDDCVFYISNEGEFDGKFIEAGMEVIGEKGIQLGLQTKEIQVLQDFGNLVISLADSDIREKLAERVITINENMPTLEAALADGVLNYMRPDVSGDNLPMPSPESTGYLAVAYVERSFGEEGDYDYHTEDVEFIGTPRKWRTVDELSIAWEELLYDVTSDIDTRLYGHGHVVFDLDFLGMAWNLKNPNNHVVKINYTSTFTRPTTEVAQCSTIMNPWKPFDAGFVRNTPYNQEWFVYRHNHFMPRRNHLDRHIYFYLAALQKYVEGSSLEQCLAKDVESMLIAYIREMEGDEKPETDQPTHDTDPTHTDTDTSWTHTDGTNAELARHEPERTNIIDHKKVICQTIQLRKLAKDIWKIVGRNVRNMRKKFMHDIGAMDYEGQRHFDVYEPRKGIPCLWEWRTSTQGIPELYQGKLHLDESYISWRKKAVCDCETCTDNYSWPTENI